MSEKKRLDNNPYLKYPATEKRDSHCHKHKHVHHSKKSKSPSTCHEVATSISNTLKRAHCLPWADYVVSHYLFFPLSNPCIRIQHMKKQIADAMVKFIQRHIASTSEVDCDAIEELFEQLVSILFLGWPFADLPIHVIDKLEDTLWPEIKSYLRPVLRLEWAMREA